MNTKRVLSSIAALAESPLIGPDGPAPLRFLADSRLVESGDAFVAFRGEQSDGHDFIPEAVARGASLIICEDKTRVPENIASILVDDCFSAIPRMARRYLEASRDTLEIIAVTGSVGKTTTREMIRVALASSFAVHSAAHSYNTLIGCALSILGMPEGTEILILEMGTNHPGEIREMVRFFPPTISMITEVAPAHLEGLSSLEGVLRAKFEITESPFLKAFFYFGDNPLLAERSTSLPEAVKSFSLGFGDNSFIVRSTRFSLDEGLPLLTFELDHMGDVYHVRSALFGRHSALAVAFALSIAIYLGASMDLALVNVERIQPPSGRGRFFRLSCGAVLLDDSYNANPASMKASLSEFLQIPAVRRIAVLGEMRELGAQTLRHHREILPFFEEFSEVFLMGGIWRELFEEMPTPSNVIFFEEHHVLAIRLLSELREGDFLVIKGSYGNRLDKISSILLEDGTR